jgi:hypothetical protein
MSASKAPAPYPEIGPSTDQRVHLHQHGTWALHQAYAHQRSRTYRILVNNTRLLIRRPTYSLGSCMRLQLPKSYELRQTYQHLHRGTWEGW